MAERGISVSALARSMAGQDGTKPESKRRWLAKVLGGDVAAPQPRMLRQLEAALQLPAETLQPPREDHDGGYRLPSRRQGFARLEALEGRIETLSEKVLAALDELDRRIDALEDHQRTRTTRRTP